VNPTAIVAFAQMCYISLQEADLPKTVTDTDCKNFDLTAPSGVKGIRFSYSQHSKIDQPTFCSAGFLSAKPPDEKH
jgi:hypothetical protein